MMSMRDVRERRDRHRERDVSETADGIIRDMTYYSVHSFLSSQKNNPAQTQLLKYFSTTKNCGQSSII